MDNPNANPDPAPLGLHPKAHLWENYTFSYDKRLTVDELKARIRRAMANTKFIKPIELPGVDTEKRDEERGWV